MASIHDPLPDEEVLTGNSSWKMAAGGYGIWEYRDESWELLGQSCAVGYQPGEAPGAPGRFDGEIVRKYCAPVLGPGDTPTTS